MQGVTLPSVYKKQRQLVTAGETLSILLSTFDHNLSQKYKKIYFVYMCKDDNRKNVLLFLPLPSANKEKWDKKKELKFW